MPVTLLPPTGMNEKEEDSFSMIVPVFENTGAQNATLYIGNQVTANDAALLLQENITSTMNVAVNVYLAPLQLANGTHIRRTQVGLIDGHGNSLTHLLAAVFALDGILNQESPGKAHYPAHKYGNVLVHCRGGRSRSLVVLAVYLFWRHRDQFPNIETAISHIRDLRQIEDNYPLPGMIKLAEEASQFLGVQFRAS
ncbi:dual specificity protein phosphatase family protein [Paenochrobactrum pullorum]|uniref:dual specificity protein phosphatase family protein n=1 Tax=Paenochrobactrum pullorum TaxID=1324351 RepID=UPI0035BBEC79